MQVQSPASEVRGFEVIRLEWLFSFGSSFLTHQHLRNAFHLGQRDNLGKLVISCIINKMKISKINKFFIALLVWFRRVHQVSIGEAQGSTNIISINTHGELVLSHAHNDLHSLPPSFLDNKLTGLDNYLTTQWPVYTLQIWRTSITMISYQYRMMCLWNTILLLLVGSLKVKPSRSQGGQCWCHPTLLDFKYKYATQIWIQIKIIGKVQLHRQILTGCIK